VLNFCGAVEIEIAIGIEIGPENVSKVDLDSGFDPDIRLQFL